jgi:F-type H+-transporting ATPase subunit gamma
MAGVSTKEIKNRIRSMESTKQITKAMEMVAASKLRRAQAQVLDARPYFETLYAAIQDIVQNNRDFSSPYLVKREVKKSLYVVIAGDRGLAGGYNSNVLNLTMEQLQGKDATVLPIGKKAVDYFKAHGIQTLSATYAEAEDVSVGDCFSISKQLSQLFLKGEYDEISIVYTNFISVLSQSPTSMQILPLRCEVQGEAENKGSDILYEPDSETVFASIIPEYLGGILYGALCESRAAEQAARRTAMDSATQNAEEMIGNLSLQFNRARQAAITQEITEIVAGSEN